MAMKTLNVFPVHWTPTIPPRPARERKLKFLLQPRSVPPGLGQNSVSNQEISGTLRLNACSWYGCFEERTLPVGEAVTATCGLVSL